MLYAAGSGEAIAALNPGPAANGNGNGHWNGSPTVPLPETEAQVLLITSPSAGEGKTTTAAHLAAVLAEFGKRVLVVSADFRRPRVHELLRRGPRAGPVRRPRVGHRARSTSPTCRWPRTTEA